MDAVPENVYELKEEEKASRGIELTQSGYSVPIFYRCAGINLE